jgi:hypothetical protein
LQHAALPSQPERVKNKRVFLAFAIAPLWIPLATIFSGELLFAYGDTHALLTPVLVLLFRTFIGYAATLVFGLPAFLLLRRRRIPHLLIAVVLGFIVGLLIRLGYVGFYTIISPGCGWRDVWLNIQYVATALIEIPSLILPGILGALVGVTLWAILRPELIARLGRNGPWGGTGLS